ncbi:FHA domain-containing protein [Frisingicoccus sp.]|uniref:FHA domain-containing protein n=1 Tax=Frisingicoccus sp. TaxID=1918627 RepID=UPI003AB56D20
MSVSKINFNDSNEAYIVVKPISDIDKEAFKTYLELDSPSFLKCEFENGDAFTLYYGYGKRITLKQFLSHIVDKEEAIHFLKSLTMAFIEAERYGMNTNHILLGINSIFYNEENGQVSCIYVPVNEGVLPARPLRLFLKEMLVNIVYSQEDDMTWLGNTIRYISWHRQFSYKDFYEFLQTQEELEKEPAAETEAETAEEPMMPEAAEKAAPEETKEEAPEEAEETREEAQEEVREEEPEEDLADLKSVLESIPAAESVTGLKFDTKFDAKEEPESSMPAEPEEEPEEVPTPGKAAPESSEPKETEEEGTEEAEDAGRVVGVLVRRINQMPYRLEQPEIRIGKSASNDICISDNPAVSRVHAIITRFDGDYRIQDNGSTNHTFVNGIVLRGAQEKLLSAGDRILLGNEEFIFKFQEM